MTPLVCALSCLTDKLPVVAHLGGRQAVEKISEEKALLKLSCRLQRDPSQPILKNSRESKVTTGINFKQGISLVISVFSLVFPRFWGVRQGTKILG